MNLVYDGTVTAGNLLTFLGFIVSGIGFAFVLRGDVKTLTFRVTGLETAFTTLSAVMRTVAVQDERILNLSKRIDEMRKED